MLAGTGKRPRGGDAGDGRRPGSLKEGPGDGGPGAGHALAGSRVLVTGGAGFIGSHLVDALVTAGSEVTVLDDLSSGRRENLDGVLDDITLVVADGRRAASYDGLLDGIDSVWHLAANPEVRTGETDPAAHYDLNVAMTWTLLEAVRRAGVPRLAFTSTSTVYGEADVFPTPEDHGPLLPISVYGGCKLACEGLIASYAGTFATDALLFRFANVVGPRSGHGVTVDFVRKLRADPDRLEILGDGTQTKSYVHVEDTVGAMLHAAAHAGPGVHPFNIGSLDAIPVTDVAGIVADVMEVSPQHAFAGGTATGAGWPGDVKNMRLDVSRLQGLGPGWAPQRTSEAAIRSMAEWLAGRD